MIRDRFNQFQDWINGLYWPSTGWGWFAIVVIMMVGCFLVRLGYLMYERSERLDRLGKALIVAFFTMAAAWILTDVLAIWPTMPYLIWVWRTLLVSLLVGVGWAWIQTEFAPRERVQKVTDEQHLD